VTGGEIGLKGHDRGVTRGTPKSRLTARYTMQYVYTVEHRGQNTGAALAVTKGGANRRAGVGITSSTLHGIKCPAAFVFG